MLNIRTMANTGAVELLTQEEVPIYFKPNDKFVWIVHENFNLLAIVYTSDLTGNVFYQGATKQVEVGLKLLESGQMERQVSYNLISQSPMVEIVCELATTDSYPLLNVFVRLADYRSSAFVFSCPCEYEGEEDELQEEVEVTLDKLYCSPTEESISFMKASSLRNGRYWLSVFLNDGKFILFEMAVKEISHKSSRFEVHCVRYIRSDEMELMVYENLPFIWTSVDFHPDQQDMAIIGEASSLYSYIYLVILEINSFTVVGDTELKGVYYVADAKYSLGGNFFLTLCSGHADNGYGVEEFKSVFIWNTSGALVQEIDLALPSYNQELCLSPHDNYFAISQSGVDYNGRQLTVFLKHTVNVSKPEAKFDAEELVRIHRDEETDNNILFSISPSGHQIMVAHSWRRNKENHSEDVSNLLLYKMDNSPAELKVLCRVAVTKHYAFRNLTRQEVPGEILSFLRWC
ncbi:hypothetical protein ACROYT_G009535 [Oculina patagonica]